MDLNRSLNPNPKVPGGAAALQTSSRRAETLAFQSRKRAKYGFLRYFPDYGQSGESLERTVFNENPGDHFTNAPPSTAHEQHARNDRKDLNKEAGHTTRVASIYSNAKISSPRNLVELRKRHAELEAYIKMMKGKIETHPKWIGKEAVRKQGDYEPQEG